MLWVLDDSVRFPHLCRPTTVQKHVNIIMNIRFCCVPVVPLVFLAVFPPQHDAPVKSCVWVPEKNFLITAAWDRTIKYWDLRSATPGASVDCGERVYAFDARAGCAVAALAEGSFAGSAAKEKRVLIFDLSNPQVPFRVSRGLGDHRIDRRIEPWSGFYWRAYCCGITNVCGCVLCPLLQTMQSPLRQQTRCIKISLDMAQYAIGSTEGRCSVRWINPQQDAAPTESEDCIV